MLLTSAAAAALLAAQSSSLRLLRRTLSGTGAGAIAKSFLMKDRGRLCVCYIYEHFPGRALHRVNKLAKRGEV